MLSFLVTNQNMQLKYVVRRLHHITDMNIKKRLNNFYS